MAKKTLTRRVRSAPFAAKAPKTRRRTDAPKPETSPAPIVPPADPTRSRLEGDARVEAETEVLLSRTELIGDGKGGLEQGAGSIGDLIRHMFQADNAKYSGAGKASGFVRDALLGAADDFQLLELALLDHDATDVRDLLARFAHRAERRAAVAVELDHRIELGLEARKAVRS